MTKFFQTSAVAVALFCASAAAGVAQTTQTDIVQAPASTLPQTTLRAFPTHFGVPSAVAAPGGTGFVGAVFATPRGGVAGSGGDGGVVGGYTVGNPVEGVSLTFGLAITGVNPFGDSGALSVSASRLIHAGGSSATFIGASAANLLGWGDAEDTDEAFSLYVSHVVGVSAAGGEVPIQFTVGYGQDAAVDSIGPSTVTEDSFFAGLGIGLTENLSAGISATETQVNFGVSLLVPDSTVAISAGILDIADSTDRQQFALSVGFGF